MALSSLPHGPFAGLGLRRVATIVEKKTKNERNALPPIWDCAGTVPVALPASLFEPYVSTVAMTIENISMGNDWVIAYAHIPTCAMRYRARRRLRRGNDEKSRAALNIPGDCPELLFGCICNDLVKVFGCLLGWLVLFVVFF